MLILFTARTPERQAAVVVSILIHPIFYAPFLLIRSTFLGDGVKEAHQTRVSE